MDAKSIIKGSVKAWRAAFPCARAVNVSDRRDIVDEDFVHIRGDKRVRLHTLNMSNCQCEEVTSLITDAAFENLRGIHTLDMSYCYQRTITDAAIAQLHGIHTIITTRDSFRRQLTR